MADCRFTPGPWKWGELFDPDLGERFFVLTSDGIRKVCRIVHDGSFAEDGANAALIAASPDLYAMLKRVEWSGNGEGDRCPSCYGHKDDGHWPDCELDALLRRVEG